MITGSHDQKSSSLPLQWSARWRTGSPTKPTWMTTVPPFLECFWHTWHTHRQIRALVYYTMRGEHERGGGLILQHPGLMDEGTSDKGTVGGLNEMRPRVSAGGGRWEGEKQTKLKLKRGWETDRDRLTICVFVAISWGKGRGEERKRGQERVRNKRKKQKERENKQIKKSTREGRKGEGQKNEEKLGCYNNTK